MSGSCLFCAPRGVTRRNGLAYAARDSYPVSPGHSLIIPFRHCPSFFDLTAEELAACMELVVAEQRAIQDELKPEGYNVGVNVGAAAGQSIFHVHIHLIPRYAGDHPNPRGGVRQVIPWKANYPRRGGRPGEAASLETPGQGNRRDVLRIIREFPAGLQEDRGGGYSVPA
jgi:diadenosine tetraphosphate (Ap4A) HIT family hydrolase